LALSSTLRMDTPSCIPEWRTLPSMLFSHHLGRFRQSLKHRIAFDIDESDLHTSLHSI
jgi:hypothetical protein